MVDIPRVRHATMNIGHNSVAKFKRKMLLTGPRFQRLHDDIGGTDFVCTLQSQNDIAGAVTLEPFVGDRWTGDTAAEMLQLLALIGAPAHRRMEAEAVEFSAQVLR